jgi:hypothetical protein
MVAMGLFLALRAKNNPTKLLFHGNFQRANFFEQSQAPPGWASHEFANLKPKRIILLPP